MLNEETFTGRGGTRIFMRCWRPESPKVVVAICHGVNSHSGQYLWVGEQLAAAGCAVYAYDHRGRGNRWLHLRELRVPGAGARAGAGTGAPARQDRAQAAGAQAA